MRAVLLTLSLALCMPLAALAGPSESDDAVRLPTRDPFRSPILDASRSTTTVYGAYSLEQLRLTAVASSEDGRLGVLAGPDGFSALVTEGSTLGSSRYTVRAVLPDRLLIEDSAPGIDGTAGQLQYYLKLDARVTSFPKPAVGP